MSHAFSGAKPSTGTSPAPARHRHRLSAAMPCALPVPLTMHALRRHPAVHWHGEKEAIGAPGGSCCGRRRSVWSVCCVRLARRSFREFRSQRGSVSSLSTAQPTLMQLQPQRRPRRRRRKRAETAHERRGGERGMGRGQGRVKAGRRERADGGIRVAHLRSQRRDRPRSCLCGRRCCSCGSSLGARAGQSGGRGRCCIRGKAVGGCWSARLPHATCTCAIG